MAETSSTTENPADGKEWAKELPVEAMNHLFQGKRHLLVHDYSSAVSSLEEACELFVKFYGPVAYECGEIHYYYGKALLELARQESGILGGALEGGSDAGESQENSDEDAEGDKDGTGDSAEEESKGESEDAEESIDGSSEPGKTDSDDQSRGPSDDKKADNAGTGETKTVETDCTNEAGPSSSVPGKQKEEKEEDITTLQLAWEVLETAKVIFQKNSPKNREDQLKVAEILLALGEISLEEENFTSSIEDLRECLRIHLQYLGPDDRLLAETYYQMGLAYTFAGDYDLALDSYQKSIDVIEIRISSLKSQIVPDAPTDFSMIDPAKEIEELYSLLPDIKAKMEDTEELKATAKEALTKKITETDENKEFGIPSKSPAGDIVKPVSNLTHLLKRKKPEDQDSAVQPAAKKLMTVQDAPSEPVTNGSDNSPPLTSA